jgi:hypothetical protein
MKPPKLKTLKHTFNRSTISPNIKNFSISPKHLIFIYLIIPRMARGGVVVKALRYKPAGQGFDSRCFHSNFSVTSSFRSHYGPGVESASKRNEYQVYFLGVKAAGA